MLKSQTSNSSNLKMCSNRKTFVIKCIVGILGSYVLIYVVVNNGASVHLPENGGNLDRLNLQQNPSIAKSIVVPEFTKMLLAKRMKTKTNTISMPESTSKTSPLVLNKVKEATKCLDRPMVAKVKQRGDYLVLYNYVMAEKKFRCHESVTYTTHADYPFMDNLIPLVEKWRGPISLALHAPGTDFKNTLDSIAYLRDCTGDLVKEYVTFHIYFGMNHIPNEIPSHNNLFTEPFNCSLLPPYVNVSSEQMYKTKKELLYPINVGRNVAREMAQTHYSLASDIELYPSLHIIPQFLKMISENAGPLLSKNPKVFPLHLFEVNANQAVPENKTRLKEMLVAGTAIPFHKKLCALCHSLPKAKEWQKANETKELKVFHVGKRNGKFKHWEPIFIGTDGDPFYDERLSWEGKSDKMSQGYALCVLDYDFLILNNAFLVHRPGIKIYKVEKKREMLAAEASHLIDKDIFSELKVLYGTKKGCVV